MSNFECNQCGKTFQNQKAVDSHSDALGHYQYWNCAVCEDMFDNAKQLADHTRKMMHYAQYCKTCQRNFVTLKAYDDHIKHSLAHQVRCTTCNQWFRGFEYEIHRTVGHTHRCKYCVATFPGESELQNHVKLTHNYRCEHCNVVVATKNALDEHVEKLHRFICGYCRSEFRDYEARQQHIDLEHQFCCPGCLISFKFKINLIDHAKEHHPLMCLQCVKLFSSKQALQTHLHNICRCPEDQQNVFKESTERNNGPAKLNCPQCEFIFDNSSGLINHYKWAHTETAVHCPKCFKLCADRVDLLEHNVSTHMAKCDKCDAHFTNDAALIHHVSMHTKPPAVNAVLPQTTPTPLPRPPLAPKVAMGDASTETTKYTCTSCNATFSTDEEWKRHQEHSPFHQDKALECSECDIKFKTQLELVKHLESSPHETRWAVVLV